MVHYDYILLGPIFLDMEWTVFTPSGLEVSSCKEKQVNNTHNPCCIFGKYFCVIAINGAYVMKFLLNILHVSESSSSLTFIEK